MKTLRTGSRQGFSLIEIIMTLVMIGVVAAMLAPYYDSGVTHSPTLVVRTEASAELQETMEDLINWANDRALNNLITGATEYCRLRWDPDLLDLQTAIPSLVPSNVTVVNNDKITMYDRSSPSLPVEYEISTDPFFTKEYLRVTLKSNEGGTLTYIFSTGTNYPRFGN